jgi:RNA polymerase sigma-70 factor, ECF subfamily
VKKAQNGNEKAFLEIFQPLEEDIYRMAFVYVKNQEDALDVVQEVAYQSFKNIQTLKKPEYFKTWVMRITINCALHIVNKNNKVVQLKPEVVEFVGSENEDISLNVSLQDMLNTLQEDEKSVVLLRFYRNFTFREISEVLEIPLGTAKSVLYRALHKLRKGLKETDIL